MNKIVIASLFLCLAACGHDKVETVKQERIDVIVSASGELESQQTAMVAPPSVSRMWQYQIKHLLPENTQVKKGDNLVSFDAQKVTDRLVDKQAELDRAKKELDNNSANAKEVEHELILAVAEKKMHFDKAKRKAEIVDNSRSAHDRRRAEIDFTIAENDLFLAQKKLQFQQNNQVVNLKLGQGKVARIAAEVNNFNRDIERLKVKAPMDGMILYKSNWQGEKPAIGESVQFGQPIIELAVVEKMQLKAQIAEPDSGKLALGQRVKIMLDGTQELVFQGEIVSIGQVFRDKSSKDKRRIIDVIIAFEQADSRVTRPGMTARIEVVTETVDNALTIPSAAVKNVEGKHIVYLAGLLGKRATEIEISHIVGSKVLVAQGLSLGDKVTL